MNSDSIKQKALDLGFDLVGITDASAIDPGHIEFLKQWISAGYAGDMQYMGRNLHKRVNPSALMEDGRSVVIVGLNYTPQPQNGQSLCRKPAGRVANYARYEDYHKFIKQSLRKLAGYICDCAGQGCKFRICVDTAPLAERSIAQKAGLGFIGKNHMLINPNLGSQIFLGEIITNLELEPDSPIETDCGQCNKCINACPTGALMADGHFNANRCINYLTIENKNPIPSDLALLIGDRVYGCDECVAICPYQRKAPIRSNETFKYYPQREYILLEKALNMTERQFNQEFAKSPIKRIGLNGLKRNARICLANLNRKTKAHVSDSLI